MIGAADPPPRFFAATHGVAVWLVVAALALFAASSSAVAGGHGASASERGYDAATRAATSPANAQTDALRRERVTSGWSRSSTSRSRLDLATKGGSGLSDEAASYMARRRFPYPATADDELGRVYRQLFRAEDTRPGGTAGAVLRDGSHVQKARRARDADRQDPETPDRPLGL